MFFSVDSMLSFKAIMMYSFGAYLMTLLKFFYKEPHPFWVVQEIQMDNTMCENISFAMPSSHLFNLQFIWSYMVYNL